MNWFSLYLIRYSKQYLYRGQYLREAVTLRFEGYCPVSLLKVSGFRKPPEGSDTFMLSSLLSAIPSATILPSPSKKEKESEEAVEETTKLAATELTLYEVSENDGIKGA